MARITDEDCVIQVPNRFELVVLAAQRAKQIAARSPITVERDNDKNTVVALREIAGPTIDLDALRSSLVDLHRQYVQSESHDEDLDEFLPQKRSFNDYDDADQVSHQSQEILLDDDVLNESSDEDDENDESSGENTEDEVEKIKEPDSLLYQDAEITEE